VKKIMVVDDEPAIRELLAAVLRDEGYIVVAVGTGTQALELLPRERPDLVLLDIMMPDIDGREVYRRMRQLPELDDTRVILASAAVQLKLPDAQGTLFLPKPFEVDALLEIVHAILDG
jgi:CheY-like chemotaxis protein